MSSVNLTLDYPLEGTFLTRHSNLSNLKFLMSLYVLNFSNNLSTALLIFIIKVKNIHSCKEVYFLTTSPKTVVVLSQLRYSFILKILVPLIYFFFNFLIAESNNWLENCVMMQPQLTLTRLSPIWNTSRRWLLLWHRGMSKLTSF